MSQSLPTAEEGTVLTGAEAAVLPGARALQEARPCSGGPVGGQAPRGQERGSQSRGGWQHGQVAAHGPAGKLCAVTDTRVPQGLVLELWNDKCREFLQ